MFDLTGPFNCLPFHCSTAWRRAKSGAGGEGHEDDELAQHEACWKSEPLHPHATHGESGARISGTARGCRYAGGSSRIYSPFFPFHHFTFHHCVPIMPASCHHIPVGDPIGSSLSEEYLAQWKSGNVFVVFTCLS